MGLTSPMNLDYVHILLTLSLKRPIRNPYLLFGLKPFFERAFRSVAGDGVYFKVFSQALSSDPSAVKRFQKPSLPFVFRIPLIAPEPQGTAEVGLFLLGWAIPFLPYFVKAFMIMLSDPFFVSGGISLRTCETLSFNGDRSPWHPGETNDQVAILSLAESCEMILPGNSLQIQLITPLRLIREGRPLRVFQAPHFIRTVVRRVSSSIYYAGNDEPGFDYKWLSQAADETECITQGVSWISLGERSGLMGEITLEQESRDILLFLRAGEVLGVGKGASYGLGRYRMEVK